MGQISATVRIVGLPAVLGAAMLTMDTDSAEAVPLPTCNEPVNCLVFDDFTVYSLALLNTITGTDDFDQKSTPGFLNQNAITIGTGANGVDNNLDDNNKTAEDVDDPYDTPNNQPQDPFTNYESISLTDPDPDFPANGDNTVTKDVGGVNIGGDMWDATTAALRPFFGAGEAVVFYFNLNETNQGGLNNGQDMYGWLQVTLTDLDNILADQVFTLSGAGTLPGGSADQSGDPLDAILPTATDLWAHVHGEICVDPTNQAAPFVDFGDCSDLVNPPANAITVNQNLGADQAAFALFNQQLSDLILDANSGYELVSVDLRMSRIDNGFEQLFILPTEVGITQVPEPSTIAMFTAGLLGLVPFMRRRRGA